jgi:hypothetical protein
MASSSNWKPRFSIYENEGPDQLLNDVQMRIRIYILMDLYRSKNGTESN